MKYLMASFSAIDMYIHAYVHIYLTVSPECKKGKSSTCANKVFLLLTSSSIYMVIWLIVQVVKAVVYN